MILIENSTEADSNGKTSEEQIFDGQSDDSVTVTRSSTRLRKNPSGAAVRRPVWQTMILLAHQILKASCQKVMSFSGQSVTSAASSALAFNGSLFRHGTRIMLRKRITMERLREL
jgi:hypothetical protein